MDLRVLLGMGIESDAASSVWASLRQKMVRGEGGVRLAIKSLQAPAVWLVRSIGSALVYASIQCYWTGDDPPASFRQTEVNAIAGLHSRNHCMLSLHDALYHTEMSNYNQQPGGIEIRQELSKQMAEAANRLRDLERFYVLLNRLESQTGLLELNHCSGRMNWPRRGVYFFFEIGQQRTETGSGLRVVRVGTHAVSSGSRTTLWKRLAQHRGGTKSGGGNHRGSIFRLIVGTALIRRNGYAESTWGQGSTAPADLRRREAWLENEVSIVIRAMPFLWLAVDDEPRRESLRGYIERNAIALVSNYAKMPIDAPSEQWLGHDCNRTKVRESGLWNQNHVDDGYEPAFLDVMERLIQQSRISP